MKRKLFSAVTIIFPIFIFFSQPVFSQLQIDTVFTQPDTLTKKAKTQMSFDTTSKALWVKDKTKGGDSTKTQVKQKRHSPMKAALFSAALPGLGQGYNKKYWKIPIVYAGFGGLGYALYYTVTEFKGYRGAYRLQMDNNPLTYGSYRGVDDVATLKSYRDYYKRYVDISAIFTAVWYTLNIVDAAVDAHLFEWNMKDDISVSWHPAIMPSPLYNNTAALGLQFQLRM